MPGQQVGVSSFESRQRARHRPSARLAILAISRFLPNRFGGARSRLSAPTKFVLLLLPDPTLEV